MSDLPAMSAPSCGVWLGRTLERERGSAFFDDLLVLAIHPAFLVLFHSRQLESDELFHPCVLFGVTSRSHRLGLNVLLFDKLSAPNVSFNHGWVTDDFGLPLAINLK